MRPARIRATGEAMSAKDSRLANHAAERIRKTTGMSGTSAPDAPAGDQPQLSKAMQAMPPALSLEKIMNQPISRRNVAVPVVGAIAAMSTSISAMAEELADRRWRELDHEQNDASLSAVEALIVTHSEAFEREAVEWDKVDRIQAGEAMKGRVAPRIQIGRFWNGVGNDGEEIFSPIYAYSDDEIEQRLESHLAARLSMCGTCEKQKRQVQARHDEWLSAKKAELAALRAEDARLKEQSGYAAAWRGAEAASKKVTDIEDALVSFVPSTLPAAARQAAWVVSVFRGEADGYIHNDELVKAMMSIGSAMSQSEAI